MVFAKIQHLQCHVWLFMDHGLPHCIRPARPNLGCD
eukprot:SAG11_NODE_33543_length_276_cov_2.073446_1_plen_35_part_01